MLVPLKIGPRLQALLDHPDPNNPWADVVFQMHLKPASLFEMFPGASGLAEPERTNDLQRIATYIENYQKDLITSLDNATIGPIRSIWINNVVTASVLLTRVVHFSERPDVDYVELSNKIPLHHVLDHDPKSKRRPSRTRRRTNKPKPRSRGTIISIPPPKKKKPGVKRSVDVIEDNIKLIGAPELWAEAINLTGKDILVAVIDTGIDHTHPHLQERMWDDGTEKHAHGFNTIPGEDVTDTKDTDGHGTACAGLLAGKHTGVAREAKLMAIKVCGSSNDDTGIDVLEQNIWDGFGMAVLKGCKLISMSMSIKHSSSPQYAAWRTKCNTLYSAGVMLVNSTGKQGTFAEGEDRTTRLPYPSNIPHNIPAPANCPPPWLNEKQTDICSAGLSSVIACGCCNNINYVVNYSGRGPATWDDYLYSEGTKSGLLKPDLAAPGVDVSTCALSGNPPLIFSGTSAATPHVAGAVALLMQACIRKGYHKMPLDRIHEALSKSAMKLDGQIEAGMLENKFGSGCVNVYDAYKYGHEAVRDWW